MYEVSNEVVPTNPIFCYNDVPIHGLEFYLRYKSPLNSYRRGWVKPTPIKWTYSLLLAHRRSSSRVPLKHNLKNGNQLNFTWRERILAHEHTTHSIQRKLYTIIIFYFLFSIIFYFLFFILFWSLKRELLYGLVWHQNPL